jgi:hypothetical protein
MVATMIVSRSSATSPAFSRARRAAVVPSDELDSESSTMCLLLIPVRPKIHSSLTLRRAASSALASSPSGTPTPIPVMVAPRICVIP